MSLVIAKPPEKVGRQSIEPLFVLKFGSSLLRSTADLPRVAGEIYRQRRAGRRIIAVVSALEGETDRLLGEAAAVTGLSRCRGVPDLVSLGEERAAALLRLSCDRIGLRAEICRAEDLGLETRGDGLSAVPVKLHSEILLKKLSAHNVVIVPGFVGVDSQGGRTLLGRGGSDYSAIFIGGELEVACVRLYKDVDGVFEQDPAQKEDARRFPEISWDDALRIARPLIQPQALEYAACKQLAIEVEALGSASPSRVGPVTGRPEAFAAQSPLRVAVAGYGVVGQALAERLDREPAFELAAILVRDKNRSRIVSPPIAPTDSLAEFLSCPVDIVVDALSCEKTGRILCDTVLPLGIHIVSASKRVISSGRANLSDAAVQGGSQLLYSAAVGGSAAVLETIDQARSHGVVAEVVGVLNGTVNFILQRLAQGAAFRDALAEAQQRGFAEENPEADLSGADAAAKLSLIAHRALGVEPSHLTIRRESLDEQRAEQIRLSGERWVQVARISNAAGTITADIVLQPLREVEILPAIVDEWNCAAVKLEDGRIYRCVGRGAGGAATAEAIVADLYELLGQRRRQDSLVLDLAC
ncbi:MAG: homoserine dehydrogenase [Sphingosinicella sp.]|nr:homoserine dehydrogenase [Sphingosinicella sp.]